MVKGWRQLYPIAEDTVFVLGPWQFAFSRNYLQKKTTILVDLISGNP
jgi:hypothetical protein